LMVVFKIFILRRTYPQNTRFL